MILNKQYRDSDRKTYKESFSRCNRGVFKVSIKSKEFLLKRVNRFVETVSLLIKIYRAGVNISKIKMWLVVYHTLILYYSLPQVTNFCPLHFPPKNCTHKITSSRWRKAGLSMPPLISDVFLLLLAFAQGLPGRMEPSASFLFLALSKINNSLETPVYMLL